MFVVQMNDTSYKNGALKEAHCTMNKQIEVKNTETLTRYHKKRQGRDLGGERRGCQHGSDNQKRSYLDGPGGKAGHSRAPTLAHYLPWLPTPVSTWAFK